MKRPLGFRWLRLGLAALAAVMLIWPAFGREALSPQEAPNLFFDSIYKMDYLQAWQVLSQSSQEGILKLILDTEQDPKLTAAGLRKLFESNDRNLQRGFWTQLRQSMDIEAWNQQNFTDLRGGDKADESFVHVMPADIYVYVKQENQNWKFGFRESFVERRGPKGMPASSPQALPSPPPQGPSKATGSH